AIRPAQFTRLAAKTIGARLSIFSDREFALACLKLHEKKAADGFFAFERQIESALVHGVSKPRRAAPRSSRNNPPSRPLGHSEPSKSRRPIPALLNLPPIKL